MAEQPKDIYAPIPARAMADEELTAEHFRVLMVVAAHDRFNRNGKGCCASHPRLARLAKCHIKSLSRSLKALAERGYIEGLPSPFNKLQRAYSVIYNDADRAIMASPIGNNPATYRDGIGNNPATETGPIGNKDFHEPEQNQGFPVHKRFSETEKRFSETVKESSVETALLRTKRNESERQDSDGQFLGKVQTWLKQHSPHILSDAELAEITKARDECLRIEDSAEAHNGGRGGWAQRLANELDGVIGKGTDELGAAVIGGRS